MLMMKIFKKKSSKVYDVSKRQNKFIDGQDTNIEIGLFNLIMKNKGTIPRRTKIMFYDKFVIYTCAKSYIYFDVENNLLDKVFSSVCCIHDEKDFIDAVVKGVNMYTWIPGLQKTVQLQAITMVKEPWWFEKLYWPPKKPPMGIEPITFSLLS